MRTVSLTIENYVVVNGAQSLSTFFANQKQLTSDLRIFVRVISLTDDVLSRKITLNSNNQNAIKPKDLRSTNDIMLRLSEEFRLEIDAYNFEIKRGEKFDEDRPIITNEEAGRLLLAFDLERPYACHQIYKVFDELYGEVFGRPEVTAQRIVFLRRIMELIESHLEEIDNKQLASYALARYFLLSCVRDVMFLQEPTKRVAQKPNEISNKKVTNLLTSLETMIAEMIVDFNHLISEQPDDFDYKRDLKSPEKTKGWRGELLRTYTKDLKRKKATDLASGLK